LVLQDHAGISPPGDSKVWRFRHSWPRDTKRFASVKFHQGFEDAHGYRKARAVAVSNPTEAFPRSVCDWALFWSRKGSSLRKERRNKGVDEKNSGHWMTILIVNIADCEGDIYEAYCPESLPAKRQT